MSKLIPLGRRHWRSSVGRQPSIAIEGKSVSDVFEALLYLRRSSELLTGKFGLEITKSRVDLAICELQEALAFARERSSLGDGARGNSKAY